MNEEESYIKIVSADIERYAEMHSSPEPELLSKLNRETHLRTHMPQMLSGTAQGTFLRMISRMLKPERILEIGTFTGYSALCLAEGLPESGMLHTIELNPEMQDFAGRYFAEAGLGHKITIHIGHAAEVIPCLPGSFDLVFIDADKENYILYFELCMKKLNPGGFILADNTLWYGKVLDTHSADKETMAIQAFNDFVMRFPGVENLMLPFRDGLTLIRKR